MRKTLVLLLTFGLLLGAGLAYAASAQASSEDGDWKFHDIVDAKFIQQYAKMPKPENVLIIDSRPKRAKYDKGYVPTAISIPHRKFDEFKDQLPEDKNTLLIFYCGGPT